MNVIKINVSASGAVSADGAPVTLEQLSAQLAELARAGGAVLYHRENPQDEPHPNAIRVIDAVARNRLPIRLCVRADFSDSAEDKSGSPPR